MHFYLFIKFFTINKLFFYIYFKYLPTDIIRRYLTDSFQTITIHAIVNDGIPEGNYPSVRTLDIINGITDG